MSDESEDIKRWTARRMAAAVKDILKGKATAPELARSHGSGLAEARYKAERKELLAKIGELTMEKEV